MYHLDNTAIWDRQAKAIENELDSLEASLTETNKEGATHFKKAKRKLSELRNIFDRQLSAINMKHDLETTHGTKERSLVFWARKYTEKITQYFQDHSFASTNHLWVDLIYARLCGTAPAEGLPIQALEHGLKSRLAILQRNEKQIKAALAASKEQEKSCQKKYHKLAVTKANLDAAAYFNAINESQLYKAKKNMLTFLSSNSPTWIESVKIPAHPLAKVRKDGSSNNNEAHINKNIKDFINEFDFEQLEKELKQ